MIIKFKINLETLELESDNSYDSFTVNEIMKEGNILNVEISKPDLEREYPTWQQ